MSATYRLLTIADLLKVPADRRHACLRDLEYALELHQFAFGEQAAECPAIHWDWTDDGDHSARLSDQDGREVVTLQVTEDNA